MDAVQLPDPAQVARPISVRRIARDTGRIWRQLARPLTLLSAALEVPLFLAELLHYVTPGLRDVLQGGITFSWALLIVALYGSLSHHFLAGVLERVVGAERHDHPVPTLRQVLHDLPWGRLVVADLLLTGLTVVGLTLFVVPGLLVMTWFAVTLPLLNLERGTVREAFARSRQLVRGHSWRVGSIAFATFLIPEVAVGAAVALTHRFTDHEVVVAAAHALPAVVLLPAAALPLVVLTFDLVDLDKQTPRP